MRESACGGALADSGRVRYTWEVASLDFRDKVLARFRRVAMPATTLEPLPKTMRAVRCVGPEDYRLQEMPVPSPGPGEIVIKLDACGVCASDVKCFIGAPLFWGDANRQGYVQ